MNRITSAQLRKKDVINLCNGMKLGYVSEVEFDTCSGQICSLIITSGDFLSIFKDCRIVFPWSRIECIGEDAVLVKMTESEYDAFFKSTKKHKQYENGS